ncbi:hypothetical protein LCX93_02285 [Sulfurimonas sp. SWIR-19]|uniref:hypothetical protein n=1 Tax=Sulfurimonas sp. SWIR-19 TaxID=2878390 RepID=UPI001CF2A190|nr:hypothetical protein [Sulfurimonas sp. SWIR-19]UCN00763.1 hypothetical protein LCX93_02285 [Sulfurimonas sp. SWIR-19]
MGFSGCAHKMIQTPANMVYDGNQVDYSKIDTLKKSTLCYKLGDADKDTSIITAAKNAQISKITHFCCGIMTVNPVLQFTENKRAFKKYKSTKPAVLGIGTLVPTESGRTIATAGTEVPVPNNC